MSWTDLDESERERHRARWEREERQERRRELTASRVRRHRQRAADTEAEENGYRDGRLTLLPPMGRWTDRAACIDMDPDLFNSPTERRNANPNITSAQLLKDQQRAAVACRSCPVQRECYADGLGQKFATGIWGGRLLDERVQPLNLIARLNDGPLYQRTAA